MNEIVTKLTAQIAGVVIKGIQAVGENAVTSLKTRQPDPAKVLPKLVLLRWMTKQLVKKVGLL